jgi:hypothetical protein
MQFEHIDSLPGSPEPIDIFEPHMPGVDVLSDTEGFFVQVRELLEADNTDEFVKQAGFGLLTPPNYGGEKTPKGQRHVAVITPGRMISLAPASLPNTKSEKELAPIKSILPSEKPLQVTAISYTKLEAYVEDKTKTKCIPFLGFLLSFAYLGHNVIVFEGHPSALEFGVKNSDALIIDSGMLPFLAENWADIVFRSMKPNPKIFIHQRKNYQLFPVVKQSSPPGWRYSEPDGEASYANILLTTLAKANNNNTVSIVSGQPLPNPKEFITNTEELEYISTLPFRYEKLNADLVIKVIWDNGKPAKSVSYSQSVRIFKAKLALSDGQAKDVSFELALSKSLFKKQKLEIRLSPAGYR